ncbi:MAG: type IV pilus secretin PilQ, partial [Steroidobacteraceae bacterium]
MKPHIAVNNFLRALVLAATVALPAGFLTAPAALAADAPTTRLESVNVQPLPGQRLEVTLKLSGPAPQPLAFTIDNPARISFDLPNTGLALTSRRIDVRQAGLDSIVAAEASGRSRLVLNLDRLMPYETRVAGDNIVITLGEAAGGASSPAVAAASAQSDAPRAGAASGRTINSLDFRRGNDGTGRVVVSLSDPRTPVNLRQQGNQIVVDFAGTELPQQYVRRFDVTDFATPVQSFDAVRANGSTRVVITAAGEFEQLAYQSDDQYVIEIQPQRQARAQAEEKPVYTGERLSMNFQSIDTRAVLQLLGESSGQNIVVNDSVGGSMTLRLQNVPWDQALDIVLRTKGLDKRRDGNVILVAPAEELATREKAELAAKKDLLELAPLRTEYLQVNYAKARDIADLLQANGGGGGGGRSGGGGGSGNSMVSTRGSVTIDERTNTLLVHDTAESIANIRQLVATLDIPVRQVQIEARIVVVSEDFSRDLGVRSGVTATKRNGNDGLFSTTGTAAGNETILGSALGNLSGGGATPYPVNVPGGASAPGRYNVNLPAANPAGSLAFMILGSDYIVDLELSAAQAEGRGQVISSPRIVAANQKEAL